MLRMVLAAVLVITLLVGAAVLASQLFDHEKPGRLTQLQHEAYSIGSHHCEIENSSRTDVELVDCDIDGKCLVQCGDGAQRRKFWVQCWVDTERHGCSLLPLVNPTPLSSTPIQPATGGQQGR